MAASPLSDVSRPAPEPDARPAERSRLRSLFAFPNPVNELAARSVAGQVLVLAVLTLVLRNPIPLVLLALGFLARVATGPTLSVFGQLATRVIAPRLGPSRPTPGPPKRFAQAMGLTFTATAVICYFSGATLAAWILVGLVVVAATLEAGAGICLGCIVFGWLQRRGLIPVGVCEECARVGERWPARADLA